MSTPNTRSAVRPNRRNRADIRSQRAVADGSVNTYTATFFATHRAARLRWAGDATVLPPRTGRSHRPAFRMGRKGSWRGSGARPCLERRSCASHQLQCPLVHKHPWYFIHAQHQFRPVNGFAPFGRSSKSWHLLVHSSLSAKARGAIHGGGKGAEALHICGPGSTSGTATDHLKASAATAGTGRHCCAGALAPPRPTASIIFRLFVALPAAAAPPGACSISVRDLTHTTITAATAAIGIATGNHLRHDIDMARPSN
mmetsp:Transcript_97296/g.297231  ORF Transcript_97296/g.297231 Transcript_97296/m.297231 type:complete len:256 (+) Transcript_97296:920-1687(+)